MNEIVDPANIEQGTDEWRQIRLGRLTASRIADAVARTKSGWGASRANLMAALIAERLTGVPQDSFTTAAMQWGVDTEPAARAAYSWHRDVDVAQVGFVEHPSIAMSGASPDGLVGDDGMVEIKCPGTAKHIDTLLGASIDDKYIKQMQFQMACAGRAWVDFVSFDPRLPEHMRLHIVRVHRDEAMIAGLERDARDFLAELDVKLAKLQAIYEAAA